MRYIVIAMMFLTSLDLSSAHTVAPLELESLKGLPEIEVFIGDISPDALDLPGSFGPVPL